MSGTINERLAEGRLKLMVVAGEASGDLHAASVMEQLLECAPGTRFCGLGGDRMQRVGMDSVGHSQDIAVVGLVEVLRVLPKAKRYFDELVAMARERRPDAVLLVDAPDFNLRLAKKLSAFGLPVVYYVSPQLWAWRRGRVNAMRGVIRRMLVLFPFEVPFYREAGIDVVHVGHPLLDVVPEFDRAPSLGRDWIVGLLPGSRDSEVRRNLPGMLTAAAAMARSTGIKTRLLLAASVSRDLVQTLLNKCPEIAGGAPDIDPVEIVDAGEDEHRYRQIGECRLCLCASGTATLEVGLLGVPMVVSYRLAPLTHFFAQRLVDLEHVCLVNLVLEKQAVPELIQHQAEPENLSRVALELLVDGNRRSAMLDDLSLLRSALGSRGASARAAAEVAEIAGCRRQNDGAGS